VSYTKVDPPVFHTEAANTLWFSPQYHRAETDNDCNYWATDGDEACTCDLAQLLFDIEDEARELVQR